MNESKVVDLFHSLERITLTIQEDRNEPYLDSLAHALELIYLKKAYGTYNEGVKSEILSLLNEINEISFTKQIIHRVIQLLLIKGVKEDVQPNHMMTPESIALFVSYFVQKLTTNKASIRLFNPASGTGNLLFTVLSQIDKHVETYASEIDPTFLKLSTVIANILEHEVEFFPQDSLRPLLLDPVDVVISDLPVGYYPDDEHASNFKLKAQTGQSYAHHLFIEQGLTYTKEGGYLIFLIPEFLFTSDQAEQLHNFLHEHAHIISVLQLAESTFKAKQHKKSIFIIRKKGPNTQDVKQPLLVMLPSLAETAKVEKLLQQINAWFEEEKAVLFDR